jgi:hypothetical protein
MKRRRISAIVAATAVGAVGAVILGVMVAAGMIGSPTAQTGKETILRVDSANTKVSCGASVVTVYIYLDDLERRASPLNANAAAGLSAFELPLRYNPKVLQIGSPVNVQLNPDLSRQNDDGDGVVRTYVPVSKIDDAAGWAVLGAVSYNPASQGTPAQNQEEGVDPIAHGGPVLLTTVNFQTVAEGTSAISIEPVTTTAGYQPQEINLFDPSNLTPVYKPITVKSTSITVSGGDCSAVAVSTPVPTPLPSSTPYNLPTATPANWHTVTAPSAPDAGRADCPAAWLAYTDPQRRFSLCYPSDFSVTASDFAVNVNSPTASGQTDNLVSVIVSRGATSGYGLGPPSPQTCRDYTGVVGDATSSTFRELSLSGRSAPACFSVGVMNSSLHGAFPLAGDGSDSAGFIHFSVDFTGPDLNDVPNLGQSILQTLSIAKG